jgi:hypothetical protein
VFLNWTLLSRSSLSIVAQLPCSAVSSALTSCSSFFQGLNIRKSGQKLLQHGW